MTEYDSMTTDRTLPVTPAERFCATVLRAYLEWIELPDTEDDGTGVYVLSVLDDLKESFDSRGFFDQESNEIKPSAAGAALLARVEAAERSAPSDRTP